MKLGLIRNILSGGGLFSSTPFVYDADAQAFFDASDANGFTVPDNYKLMYNYIVLAAKASGAWATKDFIYYFDAIDSDVVEATRKGIVLRNLRNPSEVCTLHNDYAGSHIAGVGFKGDGANFGILTPFNPSTAVKWLRNDSQITYQLTDSNSLTGKWDLSCMDGGYTQYNVAVRSFDETRIINATGLGPIDYLCDPNGYTTIARSGANVANEFMNGFNYAGVDTTASIALQNEQLALLGAYGGGGWAGGFYSQNTMAKIWGGANTNSFDFKLQQDSNRIISLPKLKKSAFNKHIFCAGDSIMSTDPALGLKQRMWKNSVNEVADNWLLTNTCIAGSDATSYDGNFATLCTPYYRNDLPTNVLAISYGTNDIAFSVSATAAALYATLKSIATKAKALGYTKVVLLGIIDRQLNFTGGMNAANFNTFRDALRTLILADMTTATAVTDIWGVNTFGTPIDIDFYVDAYNNSKFADATDATYFNADQVHLNSTGLDQYKTIFGKPLLGLL